MAETAAPATTGTAAPNSDLERALRQAVAGTVAFDGGTRAVYASDSSNYRQVPIGVVFPKDEADVVAALRICADFDAPVLGRGGGTSLAGQGCNTAVVVDFSRHMNKILAIDPVARTARVQPGVVLDDLRRAAETHGLTFGPDPATHAWCTLGGMIGNNSCGTHALYAGKTVDNVERLRVVTHGGSVLELGSYDDAAYAAAVRSDAPEAALLGGLREIGRRHADLVRERFPYIPRRVSGFNLDWIVPGRPLHAARLLVGTESTCALVTEAVVRLIHIPAHRRLVVLGYPDVFAAADAVPGLLAVLPGADSNSTDTGADTDTDDKNTTGGLLGLEGFDITLVRQMRAHGLNITHLPLLPGLEQALERGAGGWLLAEVGADSPAEADALAAAFVAALPAEVTARRLDDPAEQRGAWAIRESGLGATALRPDGGHNAEGWEDAAVAPEKLGTYLRELTKLWAEFGYSGALYGHYGQGCVHTRNNFDLHSAAGLRAYRAYVEKAADLVVSLGGSISGEHGDGQARGELLERMYGPELVDAFRQVKALFDPRGRMNPGKLVDPYPLDANLRLGPDHRISALKPRGAVSFPLAGDRGSLQLAAERCVGVGRCRRDDTGVMCPSYRATRDERHSTRGRAKLLAELFQGEATPETWRNKDVREALDLCLACKGCAVDCPTHVDMATYKAQFLAEHYRGRLRPREMYALGLIPWAARVATRVPRLANAVLGAPVVSTLVKHLGGVTTARPAPRFAKKSLRRTVSRPTARLGARTGIGGAGTAAVADSDANTATVVLWPDTFTDVYRPHEGRAWIAILESLGERVAVPTRWACCARPLYDAGMLALARKTLSGLLDVLDPYIARGVPVVVPEPSCLASFRDELPKLLHDDPRAAILARLARSPAEHLLAIGAADRLPRAERPTRVLIHPHCHARAVHAEDADRVLLEKLGHRAELADAGCCGLAGSFGFSARHEALSRSIGEQQWLPKLLGGTDTDTETGTTPETVLVLDGFSCATQYEHLAPTGAPTPTTLAQLLNVPTSPVDQTYPTDPRAPSEL